MRFMWIRYLMPPCTPLPVVHREQWSRAARSGRRVQSRVLVFKDGHPSLVGLPPPVPNRLQAVSRRFHPVALTQADPRAAEAAKRRACDAPSRCTESSSAWFSPGVRLEPSRPPCGETERRPDSSAPSPMPLASTAFLRAFARLRLTHQHIGLCNPHDPRTHLARICANPTA